MTLKYYYEKELSALQDEAQRFAKLYPDHAAALNLEKNKAHDPHVERLLEGCAFLTAKIHQMIDKEADHLPYQLIQRLWPQLAEAFPSACMVQASPLPGMPPCVELPRGTELSTGALGDETTSLQFQTCAALRVHPLKLVHLTQVLGDNELISLDFQAEGQNELLKMQLSTLPLFIDTKLSKAQTLIHLLTSPEAVLSLQVEGQGWQRAALRFKMIALDPERCMNDQQATALHAEQLLFESFLFPEKLQALELTGLEQIDFPERAQRFSVQIRTPRIDHAYEFTKDDFQLFSVPAINAFEMDLEPVLLDHKRHSYPITADHQRPESMQVLSVSSARGTSDLNLPPIQYQPLSQIIDSRDPYFVFQWPPALSFNASQILKQTVSVHARVCNGTYPRRYLRPSALKLSDKKLQAQLSVSTSHQPTAYYPQYSLDRCRDLLQLLRVQVEDLNSVDHLKSLLTLLNRSKSEALIHKISALKGLKIGKRALIKKGVFYQVHKLQLLMEESGFVSVSDRYVFGKLLHAYFQTSASITTLIETELKFLPSESTLTWLGSDE